MAAEQPPQPKRARSTSLLAQAQLQAALWERDLPRSPAVASSSSAPAAVGAPGSPTIIDEVVLWERDLPRSPAVADREVALPFTKAAFAAMTPSESNDRLTALVSRESRIIYDHALDLTNFLLSYGTHRSALLEAEQELRASSGPIVESLGILKEAFKNYREATEPTAGE